jgi:F0F1-type ATP synthase membrane subunit b/b'
MDERREHDPGREDTAHVLALVEAQLENARAEVFRAYVRARAKAKELAAEQRDTREPPRSA